MNRIRLPEVVSHLPIILAFTAIYTIWGSTYLAIRFAIETLPPFFMGGTRFLVAGIILYGWARLRHTSGPTLSHWRSATAIGGFLIFGGMGGVIWAQQWIPSGLAALLVATVPLWMVVLDWMRRGGIRPTGGIILGLILGFIGIALLIGPGELIGGGHVNPVGVIVIMLSSLSWAVGSIYTLRAQLPSSPFLATAMEMLSGGVLLMLAGFAAGEWMNFEISEVSLLSTLSLGYLIVFGSLIAFTAYIWLLGVSTPARISTYAYVNPVVAVFLGWALADEPLTSQTLAAAAVIISGVVLITTYRARGNT